MRVGGRGGWGGWRGWRGISTIRVTGCGKWSGVGNWQKAVVILVGLVSVVFGILLFYFGLRMWWKMSGNDSRAAQYLVQRLNQAENPLDLVRINWEHEIVRQECSSQRDPCECTLVTRNRRAYRAVIAIAFILITVGFIGLCGTCCENHTTLFLFVLCSAGLALVEFCVAIAVLKSYHEVAQVTPHVREVMKARFPSPDKLPAVSPEEEERFYHAMDWLDGMGYYDKSRIQKHYFSWADQMRHVTSSVDSSTLKHIFNKMIDYFSDGDKAEEPAKHQSYEPICNEREYRRRRWADTDEPLQGTSDDTVGGKLKRSLWDTTTDHSADRDWRGLAPKFDYIWNLSGKNITLNQKAYEIAVNQRCLYTIKIRIMMDLKTVEGFERPLLVNGLVTMFGFALHILAAVTAHSLIRVLCDHFERMVAHQRGVRDVTTVVSSSTNATTSQQTGQQQQQQQMMMMMPMGAPPGSQQPHQQPYQQPGQQPYEQPYQQPYQQPDKQPYQQPYQQPHQQPYQQPCQQPYEQPYQQPDKQPYQQPYEHQDQQLRQQQEHQLNQQLDQESYREPITAPPTSPSVSTHESRKGSNTI